LKWYNGLNQNFSEFGVFMDIKLHEVARIAMRAGEILLKNGAETYRVEESITKIC